MKSRLSGVAEILADIASGHPVPRSSPALLATVRDLEEVRAAFAGRQFVGGNKEDADNQ